MAPLSVKVLALTVTVLAAVRVTAPVFWVRFAVPAKVKLPATEVGFVIVAATEASSVVPAAIDRDPAVPPAPPKA